MKAIILIVNEADSLYHDGFWKRFLNFLAFLVNPKRWLSGRIEARCSCVKIASVYAAEKLLRYLKNDLRLKNKEIVFLKSSDFLNSGDLLAALKNLFRKYENEDILFYYSGHGEGKYWYLGGGGFFRGEKRIYYSGLKNALRRFRGRIVWINDCCFGLVINSYLRILGNRYLLFAPSRAGRVVSAEYSVLGAILNSWRKRKPAYPVVARSSIDKEGDKCDYLNAKPINISYCACGEDDLGEVFCKLRRRPSLRRGSKLDRYFYPIKAKS